MFTTRFLSSLQISTIEEVTEDNSTSISLDQQQPVPRRKLHSTQSEPADDNKLVNGSGGIFKVTPPSQSSVGDERRRSSSSAIEASSSRTAGEEATTTNICQALQKGARLKTLGNKDLSVKEFPCLKSPLSFYHLYIVHQNSLSKEDNTLSNSTSPCHSPVSSSDGVAVGLGGGSYPQELIDNFALNLHRIDKDVQRCDRNLARENIYTQ